VLEAVAYAEALGLQVDTLHTHVGWGLQESAAPLLAQVYDRLAQWAQKIPTLQVLNVGGGLCVKQRPEDKPLDVQTWADLLRVHLGGVCQERGLSLACEPGTFVMATAGVLVAEVNTVETRASGYLGRRGCGAQRECVRGALRNSAGDCAGACAAGRAERTGARGRQCQRGQ
jgi:diaminopimelate decarboxylase